MRFGSVCPGIEAASCAWHPLGWESAFFSEIEKFPSAVLAHHYPGVATMTHFKDWPDAAINVLVGGTPCQSFSVAGLRKGLADPRGNLMLTFGAIAKRYRPEWLVWENVPGALSSNDGRDFGAFLWMLGQLGYGFAYRILDAQYFGLAQRRRRVFVVANLGSWRRAAASAANYSQILSLEIRATRSRPGRRPARADFAQHEPRRIAGGVQTTLGYDPASGTGADAGEMSDACRVHHAMAVRRLTPRECERLQGFPDDYTAIPWRTWQEASRKGASYEGLLHARGMKLRGPSIEECPDDPRYKALGNSMAVKVMRWIGERIAAAHAASIEAAA